MHAPPGGVQIPHDALQHSSPAPHVVKPHFTPGGGGGGGTGAQASVVQAVPGFAQVPHDALQQTSPWAHVFSPHFSNGAGAHPSIVHAPLGFVQIPHDSLQHTSPTAQVFGPQASPCFAIFESSDELESAVWPPHAMSTRDEKRKASVDFMGQFSLGRKSVRS